MKRSLLRGVKSLKRCRLRQGYSESLREQAAWQATDYADVTDLWDSRLASDTDALQLPIRGHSREFAGRRKAAQQRRTPKHPCYPWLSLGLALFHFSKPIFFSSATKRGWERTASHTGSIFNSGNQGVCSSTARSSQSRAKSELCPYCYRSNSSRLAKIFLPANHANWRESRKGAP